MWMKIESVPDMGKLNESRQFKQGLCNLDKALFDLDVPLPGMQGYVLETESETGRKAIQEVTIKEVRLSYTSGKDNACVPSICIVDEHGNEYHPCDFGTVIFNDEKEAQAQI